MDKAAWRGKSKVEKKPWGYEEVWAAIHQINGKILHIRAGERTSLKYHKNKDEVLYMMSGRAKVVHADEEWHKYDIGLQSTDFLPGNYFAIQSMCLYRIEAIDDCVIIEIGTKGSADTDAVRLEDDYGRADPDAKKVRAKRSDEGTSD